MADKEIKIDTLDHLVLTCADLELTLEFYSKVMGMQTVEFSKDRKALRFGSMKINLHQQGKEFEPKALHPTPGSADLCFITSSPIQQVTNHLAACNVPVIEGPVRRTGAMGSLMSVYFRDPDQNLIEVSNRVD